METKGAGHSDRGPENSIGHIWSIYVMEVVAAQKGQCLDRLDTTASQSSEAEVLHSFLVVLEVIHVAGLGGHYASDGENHIEQGEPRRVMPFGVEIICPKVDLIEHWGEDVAPLEVSIDKSLSFQRPANGRRLLRGFCLTVSRKWFFYIPFGAISLLECQGGLQLWLDMNHNQHRCPD
jgi:hypothetical protein